MTSDGSDECTDEELVSNSSEDHCTPLVNLQAARIYPAELQRIQLQSVFFAKFFAKSTGNATAFFDHLGLFLPAPDVRISSGVTKIALNAFAMLHLGITFADTALIQEGLKFFNAGVQLVRDRLSGEAHPADDDLLLTIYVLGFAHLCGNAIYDEQELQNRPSAATHFTAVWKAFANRTTNPASWSTTGQGLYCHMAYKLSMKAVCARKASPLSGASLHVSAPIRSSALRLLQPVWYRLGSLLEKADHHTQQGESTSQRSKLNLVQSLSEADMRLSELYLRWMIELPNALHTDTPSGVCPIVDGITGHVPVEFRQCRTYSSLPAAYSETAFVIALFEVKSALAAVMSVTFDLRLPGNSIFARRAHELRQVAEEHALNLGRTLRYLLSSETGTSGQLRAATIICILRSWYRRCNDEEKLAWILEVQRRMDSSTRITFVRCY